MADLSELEAQGRARAILRAAYWADVSALAQEFVRRIRSGEFDGVEKLLVHLDNALSSAIKRHPRVAVEMLALETISFSEHSRCIEVDYIPPDPEYAEWSPGYSYRYDEDEHMSLPPWEVIAYYAFTRDVYEAIYNSLGDSAQDYVWVRLFGERLGD
jgi:hypothetical protein